jgi:hypothetical protein
MYFTLIGFVSMIYLRIIPEYSICCLTSMDGTNADNSAEGFGDFSNDDFGEFETAIPAETNTAPEIVVPKKEIKVRYPD